MVKYKLFSLLVTFCQNKLVSYSRFTTLLLSRLLRHPAVSLVKSYNFANKRGEGDDEKGREDTVEERCETRDKRQETGDGRWEAGSSRWEMGGSCVVRGNKVDPKHLNMSEIPYIFLLLHPTMSHLKKIPDTSFFLLCQACQ